MSTESTPPRRRDHVFEATQEHYYTVERVTDLLRLYPYLLDKKPPQDPELAAISRRVFGPGGWREEAAAKRADVHRAIVWLEARDWRAAYAIRARYAVGLPLRDVAGYIARVDGHTYHFETVRRWTRDGLTLLSWFLCNA